MHKTQHRNRHNNHYDLSGDLTKIKALLAETTRDFKGRAGEVFANSLDNAKEKSVAMQETAENYITKRPFKSIGIALLSGLIIGVLLNRK